MTIPITVDFIDQLDAEHQKMVMERLHFNQHVATLSRPLAEHRSKYGHEAFPILETGPEPDEQRKIVCAHCHRLISWLPKLKNKNHRAPSSTGRADSSFCQCCRTIGVNLIGHHVIEVQEGGSNDPENIWTLCEPCHQIIHALRRHAQESINAVGEAQRHALESSSSMGDPSLNWQPKLATDGGKANA